MRFQSEGSETKRAEREKRIFRIVHMLHVLGSGGTLDPRDLAGEHAVSLRTVQRDVQLLEHVGFPLIRNAGGRCGFIEGYRFRLPEAKSAARVREKNRGDCHGCCA